MEQRTKSITEEYGLPKDVIERIFAACNITDERVQSKFDDLQVIKKGISDVQDTKTALSLREKLYTGVQNVFQSGLNVIDSSMSKLKETYEVSLISKSIERARNKKYATIIYSWKIKAEDLAPTSTEKPLNAYKNKSPDHQNIVAMVFDLEDLALKAAVETMRSITSWKMDNYRDLDSLYAAERKVRSISEVYTIRQMLLDNDTEHRLPIEQYFISLKEKLQTAQNNLSEYPHYPLSEQDIHNKYFKNDFEKKVPQSYRSYVNALKAYCKFVDKVFDFETGRFKPEINLLNYELKLTHDSLAEEVAGCSELCSFYCHHYADQLSSDIVSKVKYSERTIVNMPEIEISNEMKVMGGVSDLVEHIYSRQENIKKKLLDIIKQDGGLSAEVIDRRIDITSQELSGKLLQSRNVNKTAKNINYESHVGDIAEYLGIEKALANETERMLKAKTHNARKESKER